MTFLSAARPKRWPRWDSAGAFALVLALVAEREARAERTRVALAEPATPDNVMAEVATRVRAELTAAGFDVVVVPLEPGADPRASVESALGEPRPIATLAIMRLENRPAVDVWVSDRITDKTLVKRLDLGQRADAEITAALAIHAVELLRASLLETRAKPIAAPNESKVQASAAPPVPKDVANWVGDAIQGEPRKPLFEPPTVAISAAVLHSFTEVGPAAAPEVRVSIGSSNGLAGRFTFVGPAFGANVHGASGVAAVRQELAMVEIVYAPSRRWLLPVVSAGLGGYHLHASGVTAAPNLHTEANDVWAGLADLGVGLAARLGSSAAALLEVHSFFTGPAALVGIYPETIGPGNGPTFVASLGLQSAF